MRPTPQACHSLISSKIGSSNSPCNAPEASRHLPDDLLELTPDVPWKQIRGIGNILRHEYHKIADDVVWAVVTEHAAPLKIAVEALQRSVENEN